MSGLVGRRRLAVASALFLGLVVSAVVAVHASASGGGPGPVRRASLPTPTPPGVARHAAALAPESFATNAQCGQTISASLTLNGDLVCNGGTALTVTGTDVVLNLNGHLIDGARFSTTTGVQVSGNGDTVENGVVHGAIYGVVVTGARDTISAVRTVTEGNYGIWDSGTRTVIINCVATYAGSFGIVSAGSRSTLTGDHELNDGIADAGSGLWLQGADQIVTSNVANGNGTFGIEDAGTSTTLTGNVANYNPNNGIQVEDPTVIDGGGNKAKGNNWQAGNPVQCNWVVCT